MSEIPSIVINGHELGPDLANAVRVACARFDDETAFTFFSDTPAWKELADTYSRQLREVLGIMAMTTVHDRSKEFVAMVHNMPPIMEAIAAAESAGGPTRFGGFGQRVSKPGAPARRPVSDETRMAVGEKIKRLHEERAALLEGQREDEAQAKLKAKSIDEICAAIVRLEADLLAFGSEPA